MVVHADETGQDCVAFQIDNLDGACDFRIPGGTDPINLSVANDNSLVFECGPSITRTLVSAMSGASTRMNCWRSDCG
jgi:hypothetical protein